MNDKKFEKILRSWLDNPAKVLLNPTPQNFTKFRNNLIGLMEFYQGKNQDKREVAFKKLLTNKEEQHEH